MNSSPGLWESFTPGSIAGSLVATLFFYFIVWAKTGRRPHSILAFLLCLGAGTGLVMDSGTGNRDAHTPIGVALICAAMGVFVLRDGWAATMDTTTSAPVTPPMRQDPPP